MSEILQQVVQLAALALQAEDAAIRAAVLNRGDYGGLARMENERYHQFVIWRAILPFWKTLIEFQTTDIMVDDGQGCHHFELKNWRSKCGTSELPAIRYDILKLKRNPPGFMLVTSMNPLVDGSETDGHISWLEQWVPELKPAGRRQSRFGTVDKDNKPFEFWLAGWPIASE